MQPNIFAIHILVVLYLCLIAVIAESEPQENVKELCGKIQEEECGADEYCCGKFRDRCCPSSADIRYIMFPFIAIALAVFVSVVFCCKCKSKDDFLIYTAKGIVRVSYDDMRRESLKERTVQNRSSHPNLLLNCSDQHQDYQSIQKETQCNSAPS